MSSLDKCLFRPFAHFLDFFLIFSFMNYLFILEINPLSVTLFATIFSHSEGCRFVLFMVSFALQTFLHLVRPYLFMFVFIFITLGGRARKILQQ